MKEIEALISRWLEAVPDDVAFATAVGRCCDLSGGILVWLDFRLTMGFHKRNGQWRVAHEHHSLPATN
jgi:ketosteroid isomerase-like protein